MVLVFTDFMGPANHYQNNCTSMIQPMDQEVIQSFKECYRRLLSRHLLDECKKQMNNDLNIKRFKIISHAWTKLILITFNNMLI